MYTLLQNTYGWLCNLICVRPSCLLLPDLGEVPDVEPAVGAGGGEDGLVVRRPLHLEDLVLVRLEGVQLQLEVAQVPQRHRLVRRPRGQDELGVRVEAQAVHLGGVRVHRVRGLQGEERGGDLLYHVTLNLFEIQHIRYLNSH